jgi:hypothetical protein
MEGAESFSVMNSIGSILYDAHDSRKESITDIVVPLVCIEGVSWGFVNQLWGQVPCAHFESSPNLANIMLFNDLV